MIPDKNKIIPNSNIPSINLDLIKILNKYYKILPRTRISKFPPFASCTHSRENERGVQFFFLHECFGIIIPFDKSKVDNASWGNWKTQKRDNHGNWIK